MQNNKNYIKTGLVDEKISLGKLMCTLSIALFLSGIGLDYFSAPHLMSEILTLRIAMCAVLTGILCLIVFAPKIFLKFYSLVISFLFLSASFTIQSMIFMTSPTDIAHATYFAGLMLIIVTVFMGTYITTFLSITLSIIIISSFLAMSFYIDNTNFALAVNNAFFLGSALIVGVLSNSMKNANLGHILLLQSSLKESLRNQHLETERQSELANIDAITGIANRRFGISQLEKMIDNAAKLDMLVITYFIDLNGFKQINDTYGHHVGDTVLNVTASRLVNMGRTSDLLFRFGGDEFIYSIMVEKNNILFADDFKKGIYGTIEPIMETEGLRLSISGSIGKSIYPLNGITASSLIQIADADMYVEKKEQKLIKSDSIPALDVSESEEYTKNVFTMSNFKNK